MKEIKLLFCLALFSFSLCEGQSWDWGTDGYHSYLEVNTYGSPVATDRSGNVFIAGEFDDSIIFYSHKLIGNGSNAYLVKYNSNGNLLWAVHPTNNTGANYAASVTTDKTGNVYICGAFVETVTFGTFILSSNYSGSVFLVKYSPSGNLLWAAQSGSQTNSAKSCGVSSVTTDNSNNLFITGWFADSISFGTYKFAASCPTVFLAKYDSSGNVLWAQTSVMPSNACSGMGNSIACDNKGSAYVTGTFYTAIFFGSYHLISLNNYSAFIAKYSAGGTLLWAKQSVNNNAISSMGYAYSAVTDMGNNSYITGYFEDSVQFGSDYLYSPSEYSVFLAKYDSNGNVLWAKQSSEGWAGTSLSSDTLNHIYLGGSSSISDSALMFGSFKLHAVPWANSNSFLVKFDTSGNAICGSTLENPLYVQITSDPSGNNIYMAGTFLEDTIKCGSDTLVSNTDGGNAFLGRWLNCPADADITPVKSSKPSITLFPNPNNGEFTIQSSVVRGQASVEIYNVLGERVYSKILRSAQDDNRIMLNQPDGIYLYRVLNVGGSLIGEGKVVIEK